MSSTAEEFDPYRKWLGILPKDQPPHHYRLLGVEPFEADAEVIEHAADQRMAHLRSMQAGKHAALSQRLLNEIAAAKLCLLARERKAAYDRQLQGRLAGEPSVATPPSPQLIVDPSPGGLRPRTTRSRGLPLPAIVAAGGLAAFAFAAAAYFGLGTSPESSARPPAGTRRTPDLPRPIAADGQPTAAQEPQPEATPPASTVSDPSAEPNAPPPEAPTETAALPDAADPAARPPDSKPVAAAETHSSVDLLRLVDPARDSVSGVWTREGRHLLSPPGGAFARLQVPYAPPPAYVLTAVVERVAGNDSFSLGLVVGKSQVAAVLDGWRNQVCGLAMVDGRWGDANPTTVRAANVLRGGPHTLVARVRPDQVELLVDGRRLLVWSGDSRRLANDPRSPVPKSDQLFLVTYLSSYRISRLELTPWESTGTGDDRPPQSAISQVVGDEADDNPGAETMPDQADEPEQPLPRPNGTLVGPRNPPAPRVKRPDVPAETARQQARALIDDIFKDELALAKKGEGRKSLAGKLLAEAGQTSDDPAARYVLLSMSRDLAAEAGDAVTAVRAADELGRSFEIDSLEAKVDALALTPPGKIEAAGRNGAVQVAQSVAESCVARDDYERAVRAIKFAQTVARTAKDNSLVKRVNARSREIAALARQFATVQPDLATLENQPDNADASLAAGKWYCFAKAEWQRGLPLLAAGSDAELKGVALREQSEPVTGADRASLGEAWWELGEKQSDSATKRLYTKRAVYWFELAERDLQGLAKIKVQQRLASGAAVRKNLQVSAKTYIGDTNRSLNSAAGTGIRVRQGQRVSISASGTWQFAVGQNGGADWLVVAIGSPNKPALQSMQGDQKEFVAKDSGELFLGIRDKQTKDNQGHLEVEVVVR